MIRHLLVLLWSISTIDGRHFDGGTINWAPIDPYTNASSVGVTITQTYAWSYPIITCATNVPISTSGRSTQNWNLTCVVDCTTDGGYSTQPIDILTDCTSVSASLGMMNSARSHNLSLTAGSYFYLANVGSAWVALNYPPQSGLEWSIVTFIDLRLRPDGFINTPPVASVVSPQYAFVNETMEINIPVSDVNGDDVRCRWATYTPGYRRRRSDNEDHKVLTEDAKTIHTRKKRSCSGFCSYGCSCNDSVCIGTNCGSGSCGQFFCTGTAATTSSTAVTTTTASTTTIATTTIDTPGTLKSTSSYPHQQAIDECGGICYPGSLPNGTTLSNCTITFTGLKAGVWYAVAIQVEDFINDTSTTAMSSVPVQLLIYVMPQPNCSNLPIIFPFTGCAEVEVDITISFSLYAMSLCNKSISNITDIIVSSGINGMIASNLTSSPTNSSLSYVTYTWTPQENQVGSQELCTVAYTSEMAQSIQYCVTFTVKNSSDLCVTTTTTSTSTTTESTTTTSRTTTTTSSTTTSESTTTTSDTTTTSSTSTSTTSTSTTTSSTSATTTTTTATTATTVTTTKAPASSINWPLITGLSLLTLLLSLCCCCYCLYRFCWSPAARRRRRKDREVDVEERTFGPRYIIDKARKTRAASRLFGINTANKNHQIYDILKATNSVKSSLPSNIPDFDTMDLSINVEEIQPKSAVSIQRIKCTKIEQPNKTKDAQIKPSSDRVEDRTTSGVSRSGVGSVRVQKLSKQDIIDEVQTKTTDIIQQELANTSAISQANTPRINVTKVPRTKTALTKQSSLTNISNENTKNTEKLPIEMQPMRRRSKTTSHVLDTKMKTIDRVIVTKLSKTTSSAQSQH